MESCAICFTTFRFTLATKDEVYALMHLLRQVETGIYESARLWGYGARSLTAAFKVEQHRMSNVFEILKTYRTTMHALQTDFINSRQRAKHIMHGQNIVVAKALHFLANSSVQLSEIAANQLGTANQGVQSIMTGSISHFLLPHESLIVALDHIQSHLDEKQPHMTLSYRDLAFYYNQAAFKTFRKDSTLFLVVDVPITSYSLAHTFQLYDVIKLAIFTPDMHGYYSMLATDITTIIFARDADLLIQMTNYRQPTTNTWYASDVALTFLDRDRPTCARGLIEGRLSEIKSLCRYKVHKPPHFRSVHRLHGNTFLLTSISQLRLHCPQQFGNDTNEQVLELHGVQTIHKFDCHCDRIHVDEFRIIPDLSYCNDSEDISDVSTIHYPLNLAYLTEYHSREELFNLTADISRFT